MKSKRLEELDVFKGILIITVILGHSNFEYSREMYWFHMPAFFLVSGFFFKKAKTKTQLLKKLTNKIKSLMIPYFVFIILIVILASILNLIQIDLVYILKVFYGGKLMYGVLGVFWFITVLLFTNVLYAIASCYIKKRIVFNSLILLCFLLARLEYYLIYEQDLNIILPFNIDTVFMATVFFHLGYLFHSIYFTLIDVIIKNILYVLLLACIIVALPFLFQIDFNFDMKYQEYGEWYFNLAIPVLMSFGILIISIALSRITFVKYIFLRIGKASLLIMYMHLLIKTILENYTTENLTIYILISLILPIAMYEVIKHNSILSFVFLGVPFRKSINND